MVEVKKSKIHGKGLFSTKKISKGTLIGTCEVVKTKKPNDYTLWVNGKNYDVVCDLKYINHSDKPNVAYYDDFTVMALKNIKAGKELTHKYE